MTAYNKEEKQNRLLRYLSGGVSPYHVVANCVSDLEAAGYEALAMGEPWELREHGRYYINFHGTTLAAFALPDKKRLLPGEGKPVLRIACAHTDFPCLRIKPHADLRSDGYHRLNAEVYGGAILNTWLDRPLGIAGRVMASSDQVFSPRELLFDTKRPVVTIPNLAIHMNREVNKGLELNKQTDMIPLFGMAQEKSSFATYLAEWLSVEKEDLLDYDLTVYTAEEPQILGAGEEFISAPRIDNISSVAAIMEALCGGDESGGEALRMAVFFDHEEIGSRSKQGALSVFLTDVVEKIYESLGYSRRDARDAIYRGMMLSVDVAHGLHPNHPEKEDVTNRPLLTKGFCIKEAASQSYATDCAAVSIVEQLAAEAGVPVQKFVNRSDMPGGSTLGALTGALLPMKTVDLGIPILAMHSARELMGAEDFASLTGLLRTFFTS